MDGALKKEFEIIHLQLKLILNEITLMKYEKNYNPITQTSTILTTQNLYMNITCRKCNQEKKVLNLRATKTYNICNECQIDLMADFESDDDNDIK